MTNIKYLEQSLPVAPLKDSALESCKELGEKVNNHIVNFRKEAQTRDPEILLFLPIIIPTIS